MGIGLFAGPSLGVVLVATGSAATVWLVLAALCSAVSLATLQWHRRAPRTPPRTPRTPQNPPQSPPDAPPGRDARSTRRDPAPAA
jgi:hypothetical protein